MLERKSVSLDMSVSDLTIIRSPNGEATMTSAV